MKWRKHFGDERNQEHGALILSEFGVEGYGAYQILLEIVSSGADGNSPSAAYPEDFWRKNCRFSARKFQKFVEFLRKNEIFQVEIFERSGPMIRLEYPKLHKSLDDYTRKKLRNQKESGESPLDKDKEEEKEKEKDTEKDQPEPGAEPPGDFEKLWAAYPRRVGRERAWAAFRKLRREKGYPGLPALLAAVRAQARLPAWKDPRYIPHLGSWLAGRRWLDEIGPAPDRREDWPDAVASF